MRGSLSVMGTCHVITGTPGTGKHTLAQSVSGMTGMDIIDITKVAVRSGLLEPDGVDTAKLAGAMTYPNEPVIVVGHLAVHVVPSDMAATVVVLRRSPYELEPIYQTRGYTRHKTLENLGAEILGVIAADSYRTFGSMIQIDTTGDDIASNARKIIRAIQGRYKSDDDIDWLGQISKDGTLPRFFDLCSID